MDTIYLLIVVFIIIVVISWVVVILVQLVILIVDALMRGRLATMVEAFVFKQGLVDDVAKELSIDFVVIGVEVVDCLAGCWLVVHVLRNMWIHFVAFEVRIVAPLLISLVD